MTEWMNLYRNDSVRVPASPHFSSYFVEPTLAMGRGNWGTNVEDTERTHASPRGAYDKNRLNDVK